MLIMGSVSNTLNSIDSSLISEINSYLSTQSSTDTSSTTASTTSNASSSDSVDFSQVGTLFKELQQLQQSNPTEFKQVLEDAATKLQQAASQTTDSTQAQFLTNLADKFQSAASTGDLSDLLPGSGQSGSYGPNGLSQTTSENSGNSSNSDVQNLVAEVLQSGQSSGT
jgi:hypothetical protein